MSKLIIILSILFTKEFIVSNAQRQWPRPRYYNFTATNTTNITNCGVSVCLYDTNANNLLDIHKIDNLALYADRENGNGQCFVSADFCNSDYLIEIGRVNSTGNQSFTAYMVHPATKPATNILRSKTKLMFKFDVVSTVAHYIIKFTPNSGRNLNTFSLESTVIPNVANSFFKTPVEVSNLKEKTVFFAVAQNLAPSIWPTVTTANTIPEARLFKIQAGDKYYALFGRVSNILPGVPFNARLDWNVSPDSDSHINSFRKIFYRVVKPGSDPENNRDGVLWQDKTNWNIYVTWFNKNTEPISILLENTDAYFLCAASYNKVNGDIVYITIRRTPYTNTNKDLDMYIYKVDMNGIQKLKTKLSTIRTGLNVWEFVPSSGSLTWDNATDTLAWIFPRKELVENALNPQKSIAVLVNATNFEIIQNKGIFTVNSFNNDIDKYEQSYNQKEFLSVEYEHSNDRKLHVHRMDSISKTSTVIHQSKKILEIAHPPAIQLTNSTIFFFSEDRSSTLTGSTQDDANAAPRNIAFITLPNNFTNSTTVSTQIGTRVWLTNYTTDTPDAAKWEHVMRIKTAKVKTNLIVLVYEVWSQFAYIRTDFMTLDSTGAIKSNPQTLPYPLRLNPTDQIEVSGVQLVFYSTDYTGTKMIRFHLKKVPKTKPPLDCGGIFDLFNPIIDFLAGLFG